MKRLSWRSILQRVEGRRIVGLWYGVEDGYVRIELDDGRVLLVARGRLLWKPEFGGISRRQLRNHI